MTCISCSRKEAIRQDYIYDMKWRNNDVNVGFDAGSMNKYSRATSANRDFPMRILNPMMSVHTCIGTWIRSSARSHRITPPAKCRQSRALYRSDKSDLTIGAHQSMEPNRADKQICIWTTWFSLYIQDFSITELQMSFAPAISVYLIALTAFTRFWKAMYMKTVYMSMAVCPLHANKMWAINLTT